MVEELVNVNETLGMNTDAQTDRHTNTQREGETEGGGGLNTEAIVALNWRCVTHIDPARSALQNQPSK